MPATFAVIGPGRLGQALAWRWVQGGLRLLGFVGKSKEQARVAVDFVGCGAVLERLSEVRPATVVLLAVGDDALPEVARAAAEQDAVRRCGLWLHASGRLGLEVLAPLAAKGARLGGLHPLCPIPDPASGVRALPGKLACLAGEPRALRLLDTLARRAGLVPFVDPGIDRPLYHAASALAANGLVALFESARAAFARSAPALAGTDLPSAFAATLLQASLSLCLERGALPALSGPVRRGDARGVAAHQEALARLGALELDVYRALTRRLVRLVAEAGAAGPADPALEATLQALEDQLDPRRTW